MILLSTVFQYDFAIYCTDTWSDIGTSLGHTALECPQPVGRHISLFTIVYISLHDIQHVVISIHLCLTPVDITNFGQTFDLVRVDGAERRTRKTHYRTASPIYSIPRTPSSCFLESTWEFDCSIISTPVVCPTGLVHMGLTLARGNLVPR